MAKQRSAIQYKVLSLHFNSHFSKWTWVSRYQDVSILDLLELKMMEVVMTTGAVRYAKLHSNHHHQQTNTKLFTGRMPFLSPNQQCQSTAGKSV